MMQHELLKVVVETLWAKVTEAMQRQELGMGMTLGLVLRLALSVVSTGA